MSIDLSQLPAPKVIEALSFETLLKSIKDDFVKRSPKHAAALDLESEPLLKLMQSAAYTVLHLRQRVNDAARQLLLAYATGPDLEHLAALFNVKRLVVEPAKPNANPPVPAKLESDDRLKRRVQMALEGISSAGATGAYRFHALSADGQVKDVSVESPAPGQVRVSVLSRTGQGEANEALLGKVRQALNADKVRPLTDTVVVQSAAIRPYAITAQLHIAPGPDAKVVLAAARKAVTAYSRAQHKPGADIRLSALYAALHVQGVDRVSLAAPGADQVSAPHQAPWCTGVNVTKADPYRDVGGRAASGTKADPYRDVGGRAASGTKAEA